MDFNNLQKPEGMEEKDTKAFNNLVSEFFSENITYVENEGTDLFGLFEKLENPTHKANLKQNTPGITELERNRDYIRFERSVLISNRIVKFENGNEKEEIYNKLEKCTFYIFEDFMCGLGESKAIKNTMMFLSELLLIDLPVLMPTEINMLNLVDRFRTIENITLERVKHSNIKKITIYGKANDLSDLDVSFPGFDVASITGVINTGRDERRIKLRKTGKINFYKMKDKPLYTEHLNFGYRLFTGQ